MGSDHQASIRGSVSTLGVILIGLTSGAMVKTNVFGPTVSITSVDNARGFLSNLKHIPAKTCIIIAVNNVRRVSFSSQAEYGLWTILGSISMIIHTGKVSHKVHNHRFLICLTCRLSTIFS